MVVKRDAYLNKFISKKHNGLIKVVTGVRRCAAKSCMFRSLICWHRKKRSTVSLVHMIISATTSRSTLFRLMSST